MCENSSPVFAFACAISKPVSSPETFGELEREIKLNILNIVLTSFTSMEGEIRNLNLELACIEIQVCVAVVLVL